MQRQRTQISRGEKGLSIDGGSGQRRRSSFDGPPRVVQPQQQQQPVTTMYRSRSCGNGGRCFSDNTGVTSAQKQSRSNRDFKSPERAAALEFYVQSFHSLTQSNRKSPGVAGELNSRNNILCALTLFIVHI